MDEVSFSGSIDNLNVFIMGGRAITRVRMYYEKEDVGERGRGRE